MRTINRTEQQSPSSQNNHIDWANSFEDGVGYDKNYVTTI